MFGYEIVTFFEHSPELRQFFDGVFALDTLPKTLKERHCFIFNSAKQAEIGKHWIAVANNNFHSNTNNTLEIFDSLSVNTDFIKKHLRIKNMFKFKFNETTLQGPQSSLCGQFCIWFCTNRLENPDLEFGELLCNIFTIDVNENDNTVLQFYNKAMK